MKKAWMFFYILGLCLSPLIISASSPADTKTIELSVGEAIEIEQNSYDYYLGFSGFYDDSIAMEWRNEWCDSYGKGCTMRSVNELYYYPPRINFTFPLPEYPHLQATIISINKELGTITLELKDSPLKETSQ